ncbi:DNA-3-methyladenine glycosylase [Lachnellula suecica]|uniref:DNA-3-methyladenine glycosylase n=1 Tax=Lachnellula suecica TaxID=602035 RepID=A0A8T9C6N1_9HELO|nr:DNA-3-methyladenine glycosylase [Lachnellula suecica]
MSSRRSARFSASTSTIKEEDVAPSKAVKESKKRKAPTKDDAKATANGNDAGSLTPKKKRITKISPPETPTPKAIGFMSSPRNNTGIAAPAVNRLAVPNGTNAPLVSPETHRLISSKPVDQVSPSKKSNITTTTKNLLDEALAHLIKIEPKLKPIIEKHPCRAFSAEGLADEIDPFNSLVSGIISQQVSGAAAKSIKAKFVALFNEGEDAATHTFPTPSQVCSKTVETLRTAGLSQRKAEYVLGLAEKFNNGEITADMLFSASYDEVLAELIKVRGLGKWSVEMFACFSLKRMDVFSTGDLGVQRGMAALMGRDVGKLKSKGGSGSI